jgi:hypothetical protein
VKNKERILWIGSLVIILVVSLFVVLQYQSTLSNLEHKKTSLYNENTKLQQQNVDYASQVGELKSEIEKRNEIINSQHSFDEVTMSVLQVKGFTGQLKDIVSDLKTHSELIPYKGVLGGTMGFYGNNDIHVLTNSWVLAYFSDGHIEGYMLLRYEINNGSISWKVIDSYLLG